MKQETNLKETKLNGSKQYTKNEQNKNEQNETNNAKKIIPKVLEQRLLINEEHRKILKAMEKLSPLDTGLIYIPGNRLDRDVPTPGMIAEEVGMPEQKVIEKMYEIKKIWRLPDELPDNNGRLNKEEALISALTNQHKLRWDSEINDYRVPRIHVYNAEMGTGTEYTNNKAFLGEMIFRRAQGLNEMLNSYHMQGGVMPNIISMFSKSKNQRALLTGLNKTGKQANKAELSKLTRLLEMVQKGKPLTQKQVNNLKKYVVNTIDSTEEAAESVAYELAPLLKDIPEHVPIHIYFSYNDDANLSELEDQILSKMRQFMQKATLASENLPELRSELNDTRNKMGKYAVNIGVADYIIEYLEEKQKTEKSFNIKGKSLRDLIEQELFTENNGKTSPGIKKLKKELKKSFFTELGREDDADFERAFEEAKKRYFFQNPNIKDLESIMRRKETDEKEKESIEKHMMELKDNIRELEQYELALETEKQEKMAWFTKKIAITPTQAKAKWMMEKMLYKELYENILIPTLKKITGKNLKIFVHTDREKSVFIEDPSALLGMNTYPKNKLYGTIVTSIPRTNRQRSNEPILDSIRELIAKHESSLASRLKQGFEKPTTVQQFDKRHGSAYADVLFTSWGADGFRLMPKFVTSPTTIRGEYEEMPGIVWYLKLPTRHDTRALREQMKKGNRGTWEGKRIDKGGPTTGQVIQIIHPDQSQEWFFMDDDYYERIAEAFGEEYLALEEKIKRARTPAGKEKATKELEAFIERIKPELTYSLLMNDLHYGSYNMIGRLTNTDYIRASQLVALQSLGLDPLSSAVKDEAKDEEKPILRRISSVIQTEALHGNLIIPSHGYYSFMEGQFDDPETFKIKLESLEAGLKKEGVSDKKMLQYLKAYVYEQISARPTFHPEKQKEMYKNISSPIIMDLLNHGIQFVIGGGNHWHQSHSEDEAAAIKLLFPQKYIYKGLIIALDTSVGQNYSFDVIKLPSNPGVKINAVVAHKMWHGSTEISALSQQALKNKEDALFYITADRHHPGQVAEGERYFVLDVGKQSPMPYAKKIGKTSSVRGTMALGYSPNRDLFFSTRYWLDPVVHKVVGWDEKAKLLKTSNEIIKKEMAEYYSKHEW